MSSLVVFLNGTGRGSEADPITLVILLQVKCLEEYCAINWGDQGQRDFVRNTTYLLKKRKKKEDEGSSDESS
jgi:hypothetical protein